MSLSRWYLEFNFEIDSLKFYRNITNINLTLFNQILAHNRDKNYKNQIFKVK